MISIIIPVYNGEGVIGRCLSSIYDSKIDIPFEIIVIDDGSTDNTAKIIQGTPTICRYYKINKSGVAAARNFGIRKARGEILFFFDADVKLKNNTISSFLKHFQQDRDAYIIQGRWDKKSLIPTFSSRFLLLKYIYNFNNLFNKKRHLEVATLETGCLAIRRDVFDHFSGFDERYKFSGGEEHEFGLRLLEKYKIYYYPDIFVEHSFGSIFATLPKIYRRTINFSLIFFKAKNKNFMKLHKNSVPIQDRISVAIIFLLMGSIVFYFLDFKLAVATSITLLAIYILNISCFLIFLMRQENFFFAIAGAFADFAIMIPRFFGVLKAAFIFYILGQKDFKI